MSEELLKALNPGKKFDQAGDIIFVTNVSSDFNAKISRIEVDKSRQTVKAFAGSGELYRFFPATVGSGKSQLRAVLSKSFLLTPIQTIDTIPITNLRVLNPKRLS